MQVAALEKAKDRLSTAKDRLKNLEAPDGNYDSARRYWYDFLMSSNAVFSVLEQGAKGNNQSEKWFAARRLQRQIDPLLCYLHHARNVEEHAISSVTALDRQKMVLVEGEEPVAAIEGIVGNQGIFKSLTNDLQPNLTKVTSIRVYPDRAKLLPVKDRGKEFAPPEEHLGSKIVDCGPMVVAQLMVKYLEQMIDEAEALAA